ncbi:SAM-dependent methyltransferase [Pontibacillus salicampi]|uniref:SAM-dependent methyltransferase n=1 Tax=Pontibacillus salicampi TaxID=1449801 RepID=A0ABV6LJQ0_9BACI
MIPIQDTFIPYDTFIERALYHQEGFYEKKEAKIGQAGDFYTSVSISPLFAQLMALYFIRTSRTYSLPLHICEIGGGDGSFAKQVCTTIEEHQLEYHYFLVERSNQHRDEAAKVLQDFTYCTIYESLEQLMEESDGWEGIVFSNEWLDAQPVKVLERMRDTFFEIGISEVEGQFQEMKRPADYLLLDFCNKYQYILPEGFRLEVPLYMPYYAASLATLLKRGVVATIDYGYTHTELQHPARREGTLRGYQNHIQYKDYLSNHTSMDLTHHVHWDTWDQACEEVGLINMGRFKQQEFLMEQGIIEHLQLASTHNPFSEQQKQNRAIRTFIMGDQLANSFDVSLHQKGIT